VTCETTKPKRLARPFFNDPPSPKRSAKTLQGPGDPHALANTFPLLCNIFQHGLCNAAQIWTSGMPLRDFAHGHTQCTNSYAIPRSWPVGPRSATKLKGDSKGLRNQPRQ
jgi:hypothetical protein